MPEDNTYKPPQELIDILESNSNQDSKSAYINGRFYSTREILEEIKKGTPIGRKLVEGHLEVEKILKK